MDINESIDFFVQDKKDYFKQWIFDKPFIFSAERMRKLERLQKIIFKLVTSFVCNYERHKDLMPVSEEVQRVLNLYKNIPYTPGTYRTDFVYDNNAQEKIIEITCRFALNGVFTSGMMVGIAKEQKLKYLSDTPTRNYYSPLIDWVKGKSAITDTIHILKGKDIRNESKLFTPIFERANYKVIDIYYTDIPSKIDKLKDSLIICELSFEEILSLSSSVLSQLIKYNIVNDLRTVFLIHDKRFFEVINNMKFLTQYLSESDIEFFQDYLVPTFTFKNSPNKMKEVKNNQEKYILKHPILGKSQQIYAGPVTSKEEWLKLFNSDEFLNMVVQEWVPQKTYKGTIKGKELNDYITGTLLFVDNGFYGFGDFRTSAFPVTNKVDHRKATYLVIDNKNDFKTIKDDFVNFE